MHVTSNATVCTDITYRRIEVKHGIERVRGRTLRFTDGTEEDFDVLLAATGYEIDLDFVAPEVIAIENNELDLYMRIVPVGWPGLFLQGFFNTDTALNMVFEHQARWVREILLNNAALPGPTDMRRAIADRKAWYARQYKHSPRHTIEGGACPLPDRSRSNAAPDACGKAPCGTVHHRVKRCTCYPLYSRIRRRSPIRSMHSHDRPGWTEGSVSMTSRSSVAVRLASPVCSNSHTSGSDRWCSNPNAASPMAAGRFRISQRSQEILDDLGISAPFQAKALPWRFGRSFT